MLRRRNNRRRKIPYGMFDLDNYGLQARNARILERVYHKGQKLLSPGVKMLMMRHS